MADLPVEVAWTARLPGTWTLVAALVAVHAGTGLVAWAAGRAPLLDGLVLSRSASLRVWVGGQAYERVAGGEAWRLLTSVFLHADALHLGLNAVALLALGRVVEPWLGARRLWLTFLLGGLGGSLASQAVGVGRSDGASGGAFALLGLALCLGWRLRDRLAPDERWLLGPALGGLLALNLVLSFALPFVDAAGHLGGLLCALPVGVGVSLVATPPWSGRGVIAALERAAIVGIAALGVWGLVALAG